MSRYRKKPVVIDLMQALKESLRPAGEPRVCDNCGSVDALGVVTVGYKHYCGGTWQLRAPTPSGGHAQ